MRPATQPVQATTAVLAILLAATAGCGGYDNLSPTAYEYAKALYSITNRQADDKLDGVSRQIEASLAAAELSEREAAWLQEIIGDAEAGNWKTANRACRAMMEQQIH